ncbi:MAG: hypothetical protein DRO00_01200 [Thermoproteota archaeon]|nr:MAG: hypothetical protein DRO00_01200 [Candidatus Korarchaeota archaeon]
MMPPPREESELLKGFIAYLKARGLSERTIKENYSYKVRKFLEWLNLKRKNLEKVSLQDCYEFLSFIQEKRRLKNRTLITYIAGLTAFFDYLKLTKKIDNNPWKEVPRPRIEQTEIEFLDVEEIEKLIEISEQLARDPITKVRDPLIIHFLFETGVRISELCSLRWEDIDWKHREIKIRGKGGKERIVFISLELAKRLRTWMLLSEPSFKDEPVLGISQRSVQRLMKKLSEATGKRITAHMIRHSTATNLLKQGASVEAIRLLLGHSSLSTTQKYMHLDREGLREEWRKLFKKKD